MLSPFTGRAMPHFDALTEMHKMHDVNKADNNEVGWPAVCSSLPRLKWSWVILQLSYSGRQLSTP